jgi:hypothetical protein
VKSTVGYRTANIQVPLVAMSLGQAPVRDVSCANFEVYDEFGSRGCTNSAPLSGDDSLAQQALEGADGTTRSSKFKVFAALSDALTESFREQS